MHSNTWMIVDWARKAITTKYFGPTTFRCSRIKATCGDNSFYVPYNSDLSTERNHVNAALMMLRDIRNLSRWEEPNDLHSGYIKDGMVHVQVPKKGV